MSASTGLQIRGLQQLKARLQGIDKKLRRKVLRAALQAGNAILLAEIKANMPGKSATGSGTLRASLGRKVKLFNSGANGVGIVGARTKFIRVVMRGKRAVTAWAGKYAMLYELGTKPHAVGKGSKSKKGVQTGAMHPGTPAHHVVRDAAEARAAEVLAAMGDVLKAGIEGAGG
jgi:HK97 gp10 family phage protein